MPDESAQPLDYESREPSNRSSKTRSIPLRVPNSSEWRVTILELIDSNMAAAATEVLQAVGIPCETTKPVRTNANRRQWQPGVRDLSVWSADESAAREIVATLTARRQKLARPKRSTDGHADGGHTAYDIGSSDFGSDGSGFGD